MNVTTRDLVISGLALLVFPLVVNVTAVAADGDGRSLDDPLFHRGGDTPVESAGR